MSSDNPPDENDTLSTFLKNIQLRVLKHQKIQHQRKRKPLTEPQLIDIDSHDDDEDDDEFEDEDTLRKPERDIDSDDEDYDDDIDENFEDANEEKKTRRKKMKPKTKSLLVKANIVRYALLKFSISVDKNKTFVKA